MAAADQDHDERGQPAEDGQLEEEQEPTNSIATWNAHSSPTFRGISRSDPLFTKYHSDRVTSNAAGTKSDRHKRRSLASSRQALNLFSRKAFRRTEIEEKAMAAAASIGFRVTFQIG